MVNVEDAVVARLKTAGTNLEVLVDSENAVKLKEGEDIDINDVLASQNIFFDAKKGMLASETKLKEIFGTDDPSEIAKKIIKQGEVQLTAEFKNKLKEQKKKKVLQLLHMNCVEPRTKNPIPLNRLELALDEAKIKIDEHKSAEQQLNEIVKKLHPVLPIKMEKAEINAKIPPQYAGKSYSTIKSIGTVLKEAWQNDGSLNVIMEVAAGQKNEIIDKLNDITKGEAEIKVN
ncbi:MAG: ribosome assembly factor SBDS [Candidatus Nanoarchaeia archaeon]